MKHSQICPKLRIYIPHHVHNASRHYTVSGSFNFQMTCTKTQDQNVPTKNLFKCQQLTEIAKIKPLGSLFCM